MERAVFELFMKQALECVLDFCRNMLAALHNRYFFSHPFPDFWNFTCVYFETPCIYFDILMHNYVQRSLTSTVCLGTRSGFFKFLYWRLSFHNNQTSHETWQRYFLAIKNV